jgi:hypothetical protein
MAHICGLVAILSTFNAQIAVLEADLADHLGQNPGAEILLSQPGPGVVMAARVLGDFGDDPDRYADAKSRRDYAGTGCGPGVIGDRRDRLSRRAYTWGMLARGQGSRIGWWQVACGSWRTLCPVTSILHQRTRP